MYLLIALKVVSAWYFGMRLPTKIVQKKYAKDGSIRVWPFWLFFFVLLLVDEAIEVLIGYAAMGFTAEDFIFGEGHTLNTIVPLLYIILPIVAASRRYKACTRPVQKTDASCLVEPLPQEKEDK